MALSKGKVLGQVWTPEWVVGKVLDEAGFLPANSELLKAKILEPSFGEGVFIQEIITRLVESAGDLIPLGKLSSMIDDAVHGVEYDEEVGSSAIVSLKSWAKEYHRLALSLPNLVVGDALDYEKYGFFDYVVGNPPYVRVHNLSSAMREKAKKHSYAQGTTDLYVIFYELGINWLNPWGKLVYITPNSWLKNASQFKFRKEILEKRLLKKIINFNHTKVFPKASIYTCITVLNKAGNQKGVELVSVGEDLSEKCNVSVDAEKMLTIFKRAGGTIPTFDSVNQCSRFLTPSHNKKGTRLSSLCKIQNGLSTLGDKYFFLDDFTPSSQETPYVLPAIKATTFKGDPPSRKMIFPYRWDFNKEKYFGLTEQQFYAIAPRLLEILRQNKQNLSNRNLDKNALWFWYGRSQAIQETGSRKLIFSSVLSPGQKKVDGYIISGGNLVYSGLFITETAGGLPLEEVKIIIESPRFVEYCHVVGKTMSGGYVSVSSPLVKNFKP